MYILEIIKSGRKDTNASLHHQAKASMYYVSQLPLPVVKEWLVGDAWGAEAHSPLVISTRSSIGSTLLAVCALLPCGGHGCGA